MWSRMSKVESAFAETETGDNLCRESNIICHILHISMWEYLQYVEPLDDNQPLHEIVISLLILNTKHYGIKISKFNIIYFLSTTNNIFWQLYIDVGIFRKKMISCIQTVCKMDIAYPSKKKQKIFAKKIKEAIPSELLRIYEKFNFYEIWNKYNEIHLQLFIFSTFPIHTMIKSLLQRSSIHVFPMAQSTYDCTQHNL